MNEELRNAFQRLRDGYMRVRCRPARCEKIVVVNGIVVALLPKGRWWADWGYVRGWLNSPRTLPFNSYRRSVDSIVKALGKLGWLDADLLALCVDASSEYQDREQRTYELKTAREYAGRHGFDLVERPATKTG